MEPLHTHYDNLKVLRTAPASVIRAAYKTLSQQYHPDRNPGNNDAERIMKILNASYEVLSNESSRQQYDAFLHRKEAEMHQAYRQKTEHKHVHPGSRTPEKKPQAREQNESEDSYRRPPRGWEEHVSAMPKTATVSLGGFGRTLKFVLRYWFILSLVGFALYAFIEDRYKKTEGRSNSKSDSNWETLTSVPKPVKPVAPRYERPLVTPGGTPWPTTAAYLPGYYQDNSPGLSTVTVDNTGNSSDVFVKIVKIGLPAHGHNRIFYIPAYSQFQAKNLERGSYVVKYQDLASGTRAKSDPFVLSETETYGGTQFSNVTMTLFKVANGNMRTTPIGEHEF